MAYFPEPVARLVEALQRLPGVGPKTAQRLTFFLLKRPADEVNELATALTELKTRIIHCTRCWNVKWRPMGLSTSRTSARSTVPDASPRASPRPARNSRADRSETSRRGPARTPKLLEPWG